MSQRSTTPLISVIPGVISASCTGRADGGLQTQRVAHRILVLAGSDSGIRWGVCTLGRSTCGGLQPDGDGHRALVLAGSDSGIRWGVLFLTSVRLARRRGAGNILISTRIAARGHARTLTTVCPLGGGGAWRGVVAASLKTSGQGNTGRKDAVDDGESDRKRDDDRRAYTPVPSALSHHRVHDTGCSRRDQVAATGA